MKFNEFKIVDKYRKIAKRMSRFYFPYLSNNEIEEAIEYSIGKRFKNTNLIINNNYKKKKNKTTLAEISDYILERQPIITAYGVMYKKHSDGPNPIAKLLQTFMEGRDEYKKEMFKYPKGSELFEKFNLLQLLAKIDRLCLL